MSTWHVRHEGSPAAAELPSAQRVVEGLRDGDWEPTDEVRGPADHGWVAIEDHPQFAEAVADMEPPPPRAPGRDAARHEPADRRGAGAADLLHPDRRPTPRCAGRSSCPAEPAAEQTGKPQQVVKFEDIKDRVFKVRCGWRRASR